MAACWRRSPSTRRPAKPAGRSLKLDAPVQIQADTEYVVSYRTDDNYQAARNFFGVEDYTDPFGTLTAPGIGNGVYAYGPDDVFPTQTYRGENYWADVTFEPGAIQSGAPLAGGELSATGYFSSTSNFILNEEQADVGRVTAVNPDGDKLTFEIVGGQARGLLDLDPDSGELVFKKGPPGLTQANEVRAEMDFEVIVRATDTDGNFIDQTIDIHVGGGRDPGPPTFVDASELARPDLLEVPIIDTFEF